MEDKEPEETLEAMATKIMRKSYTEATAGVAAQDITEAKSFEAIEDTEANEVIETNEVKEANEVRATW